MARVAGFHTCRAYSGRQRDRSRIAMYKTPGELALAAVYEVTGISPWRVRGAEKVHEVIRARWIVVWILRQYTGYSLAQISRAVGVDSTTAGHAVKRMGNLIKADRDLRETVRRAAVLAGIKEKKRLIRTGPWSNDERSAAKFLSNVGRTHDEIAWALNRTTKSVSDNLRPRNKLEGPISNDPDENEQLLATMYGGKKYEDFDRPDMERMAR